MFRLISAMFRLMGATARARVGLDHCASFATCS